MTPEVQGGRGEVPLGSYVRAIQAHPFVVVAAIVAALAGAAVFLVGRSPSYETTTRVLVTPLSPRDRSFTSLPLARAQGDPGRAVQTAAGILENPVAAEAVADRVEGAGDANQVRRSVTVEPDSESNLVSITANTGNAQRSADIANEYVRASLEARSDDLRPLIEDALVSTEQQLRDLRDPEGDTGQILQQRLADLEAIRGGDDPTMSVANRAIVPTSASGLARPLILGLTMIAGTVIGLVASLLIELLVPRRIRAETDVLQSYPLSVLARVPFVPVHFAGGADASISVAAGEAYRSLRTQLELRLRNRDASGESAVVVVTSSGRGDGRTTTALALAQAVTRRRRTAVVIELDVRSPALATRLGLDPERDLSSLHAGASLGDLQTATSNPRLSVIAAPPETDLALIDRVSMAATDVVVQARSLADWVIVDAPPVNETSGFVTIGNAWDELVLVSRLGHTDGGALAASRDLLEGLAMEPAGHVIIGVARAAQGRQWRPGLRSAGEGQRSAIR